MEKLYAIIPVSRFSHAKTRLSPTLSPSEREGILKAMLTDVSNSLKDLVSEVVVISADEDVLDFAYDLGISILQEKGQTDLNGALNQAMEWCAPECHKVLITPSDIPLIGKAQPQNFINQSNKYDMVIAPAKGGGTNALLFKPGDMELKFGDYSFFEHIKEANRKDLSYEIYDSFYLSLDVNTAEDLGEIILHGEGTHTREFLNKIPLSVNPHRGSDRLEIRREIL
ncbi:2-phospho-L-lactate guanylyltransferase [Methanobacterium alkalithermotolerans]|uniref:2-phospho-L-lactate guanylyltransferase n=1 Tax=Methanobacterium alkalithermotolerans TaxID=2731220 RepID=A0A8T8KFE9_9EURY|nr:2-phospho-L-lactate guanylyltransferase [Methanobacterium alkalithermotolerans]QUH24001.1 2-phospho-L-lactate guanylyltransferase [Methanobacterium alkalithermotolerans]RJS48420.1 MAG: 2-phospho-L-lactate guanylyltransferase [Methanobacterium sp.]